MARKDVDLVIRAKDEAENVIKSITSAFNDFIAAQKDLSGQAGTTESALGKVGAAVSTVQKQLEKFSVGQKIADDVQKASAAVARLESASANTKKEVSDLQARLAEAAVATEKYQKAVTDGAAAVEKQKASIKSSSTAIRDLRNQYRDTVSEQEKLTKRADALPAAITKQEAALAKTVATNEKYRAKMAEVATVSKTLQNAFDASERNVSKQVSALANLRQELAAAGPRLAELASAATTFAAEIDKSEKALVSEKTNLAQLNRELVNSKAAASDAAKGQAALEQQIGKAQSRVKYIENDLARAKTGYESITAAAQKFNQAVAAGTSITKDNLASQLVDQGIAAQDAKTAMIEYDKAVKKLTDDLKVSQAFGRTGQAAKEYAVNLQFAKQAANEASLAEGLHREALQRMGQAFASSKTDAASLAQAQQVLIGEQQRLAASLAQVAAEGFKERQAIRDLGSAASQAATGTQSLSSATGKAASETGALGNAYRRLHGDTRTTLDLTQRLRGQVLALVAAYGGLYGVINILGDVTSAYQKLEGAQARLNVVNNGDVVQSAKDLDFLRRNAERLGVDLGTLSTEYSKFAIATKGTNLEGQNTRKIFLAVAEAARVNRSSTEEMQGVFTALTQIVSKGAVQMEELRQQLGDRLPGAIQLMASALGVTTAQLVKMMQQGQVTADALIPFADKLSQKFGVGLDESLKGVATALGRVKNAVFEAETQFGKQGYLESFIGLLNKITEFLQSGQFESFSQRLSTIFARLADVLSVVIDNFQLFLTAAGALVGLKMTGIVIAIGDGFISMARAARSAAAGIAAVEAASAAAAATATAGAAEAATSIGVLEAAAGPIGIAIAAIGAGIGLWLSSTNSATEAMAEHKKIVDQVKNAYDAVNGSVVEWKTTLNDITNQQAIDNETKQFDALKSTITQIDLALKNAGVSLFAQGIPGANLFVGASSEYVSAVRNLLKQMKDGKLSVFDFRKELDKLANTYRGQSTENNRLASQLDKLSALLGEQAKRLQEAQQITTAVSGSTKEAQAAFDALGNKAKETSQATQDFDKALQALEKTQQSIAKTVPKAATDTQDAADAAKELASNFEDALTKARALPDAIMRAAAEQKVMNSYVDGMNSLLEKAQVKVDREYGKFTTGREAAAAFLRKSENFTPVAKYDVNAYRAGYGSDTTTLADGSIQKIVQGMRVSVQDAERDLARRIKDEFEPIAQAAVGSDTYAKLLPQQQAALISIAYNFGKIPKAVADAVKNGSTQDVVKAIEGLGARGQAGTKNEAGARSRSINEAALYGSTSGIDAIVKQNEKDVKAEEKKAEKAKEYHATLQDSLVAEQQITAAKQQGIIAEEQAKAIAQAEAAAKRAGTKLTEEEIAKIKEATAAKYAQKAAEDATKTARQKAVDAEQRVTALMEQQRALQEQLNLAKRDGNTDKQQELKDKLAEVNAEIAKGITNARDLWKAVGGSEADTAQIKLDTAALKTKNLADKAQQVYFAWNKVGDLFINGVATAFDKFSQEVANGVSPMLALRDAFLQFASDFLRQIAQMIIKQAIFNALKGTAAGSFLGIGVGTAHTGGIAGSKLIGSGNEYRTVNPAIFANAMRYHTGGIAGLRPGEVPAILQQGENVQTANDPFHPNNLAGTLSSMGGSGGSGSGKVKIVNAIDSGSFLAAALQTEVGERVLMNWLKANSDAVNSARA